MTSPAEASTLALCQNSPAKRQEKDTLKWPFFVTTPIFLKVTVGFLALLNGCFQAVLTKKDVLYSKHIFFFLCELLLLAPIANECFMS